MDSKIIDGRKRYHLRGSRVPRTSLTFPYEEYNLQFKPLSGPDPCPGAVELYSTYTNHEFLAAKHKLQVTDIYADNKYLQPIDMILEFETRAFYHVIVTEHPPYGGYGCPGAPYGTYAVDNLSTQNVIEQYTLRKTPQFNTYDMMFPVFLKVRLFFRRMKFIGYTHQRKIGSNPKPVKASPSNNTPIMYPTIYGGKLWLDYRGITATHTVQMASTSTCTKTEIEFPYEVKTILDTYLDTITNTGYLSKLPKDIRNILKTYML